MEQQITVLYNKVKYQIQISSENTVRSLQYLIYEKTNILPHLQELKSSRVKEKCIGTHINLKIKELNFTNGDVLVLTRIAGEQAPFTSANKHTLEDNINFGEKMVTKFDQQHGVSRGIKWLNNLREAKKLLVMDLDKTSFDCDKPKTTPAHLAVRPYLDTFLTRVYQYYDIAIWSATKMESIEDKVVRISKYSAGDYKVFCYIDMIPLNEVYVARYGNVWTKPLRFLWNILPQFDKKNSIICDDNDTNFYFNKENGITIRPYDYTNYNTDNELVKLAAYLEHLAKDYEDFSVKNHSSWRSYQEKKTLTY